MYKKIVKRFFDLLFGVVGFCVLVPVYIIVKLFYLCSGDRGDIIYKQKRIGQDGRPFNLYKFRSMVMNADDMLEHLLKDEQYRLEWERNQKIQDDPRVTRIGKFLRESSLDELPQMINVLKGDMSIVGPRPLVEGELESHGGKALYWQAKPGITGWWACHGRSNVDYHERLEMEYYYVRHLSWRLDLVCVCKTIVAVLWQKGAK